MIYLCIYVSCNLISERNEVMGKGIKMKNKSIVWLALNL